MKRFSVADFGDLDDVDDKKNIISSSSSSKCSDKTGKIMVMFIASWFVILSVIACAIDNPSVYTESSELPIDSGDTAWILCSTCLVLFMTPGLAFFYGGMVENRNVISTMMQSFVSLAIITVLWVIVGFSLAFGNDVNGSGVIGSPSTYFLYKDTGIVPHALLCPTIPFILFSMFQLMFAIITPILISGAVAERLNFYSWIIFISLWHILVYTPLVHMVWSVEGRLRKWGYVDFAGGLPVEMASGYSALVCAMYVGPRRDQKSKPSNIPLIILGTSIFWFGWLGFNSGSALGATGLAALTLTTTHIGGASAMLTWLFIDVLLGRPITASGTCNGVVIGLVALTPSSGFITPGSALVTGILACIGCYFVGNFMKNSRIDDTFDVFAVHGIGGTIGVLCTGLFASSDANPSGPNGLIYGNGELFGKCIAVILVSVPFIMMSTYVCLVIANYFIPIRVSEDDETLGLDYSMHNESLNSHTLEILKAWIRDLEHKKILQTITMEQSNAESGNKNSLASATSNGGGGGDDRPRRVK